MTVQTHVDRYTTDPTDMDCSVASHPVDVVVDLRGDPKLTWAQEHAEFLANYNLTMEREGLPLSEWRSF
jgi:hypothetical protein